MDMISYAAAVAMLVGGATLGAAYMETHTPRTIEADGVTITVTLGDMEAICAHAAATAEGNGWSVEPSSPCGEFLGL